MRSRPRTRRAAGTAATGSAAAAPVADCGSSGSGRSCTPSASGGSGSPAGATPQVTHDPRLGTIVTDSAGLTLHRFDQDGTNPPESYCNGNRATLRPPEQAHGTVTAKGVDSTLLGTVTRSDGTEQVTVNGSPFHRFPKDTEPGETNGEGAAGAWFAVTPTGGRARPGGSRHPVRPGPPPPRGCPAPRATDRRVRPTATDRPRPRPPPPARTDGR
ncbi:hypothetical protein ACIRVF_34115 [Kitasatospora sp. NPDC101157]|uniref:hypothetical protein n=1 Tax=Kitasatospora sp. NPDC101157 TaxID=3364098 RepID=UPI00381CA83A